MAGGQLTWCLCTRQVTQPTWTTTGAYRSYQWPSKWCARLCDQLHISEALTKAGWLAKEQVGFRSKEEECLAQVAALHEVCERCCREGKTTYIAFIDLRKAYDTVPHSAMLWKKLAKIGVKGWAWLFIKWLYEDSWVRIWLGQSLFSKVFLLERGLRQGCTMLSPMLFDIYINDLAEALCAHGVTVTGLPRGSKVGGILFADELAILAPTRRALHRALRTLSRWVKQWEMSIGHAKWQGHGGQTIRDCCCCCCCCCPAPHI
ncbi:MAG: reverse transcriptase domain-containing protein [Acidimicrobiales bacterium]